MIEISKEEIRDKMFFVRDEDSNQPIAVIKVADLLEKEVKKNEKGKNGYTDDCYYNCKLQILQSQR